MLKLASPGRSRRLCGIVFNIVLIGFGMYAVSSFAKASLESVSQVSRSTNSAESADKKFTMDVKNTATRNSVDDREKWQPQYPGQ
jgi:hypothetical protein